MALTDLTNKTEEEIIDISIAPIKKQKFRINGDPNKVIELNLTDINIASRMEEGLKNIAEHIQKLSEINMNEQDATSQIKEIDKNIRKEVDFIFDYPVSDKCSDGGTMVDPKNGVLRYEHIMESLLSMYAKSIQNEYRKLNNRIKKHTEKYTAPKKTSRDKK